MAAYQTGTVKVTSGSSKIFGNGTEWNTYISVGDLFQRTTENVFYTVAAVNTATQITLTSRYSNTGLTSAVATNVASVTTATKIYSGNVGSFTPVIQNSFVIVASPGGGGERFTDNGAGVLTGEASPAGSGTIDYDSGAWSITFGSNLTATLNLQASFNRGNYTDGAGYQIVSDFTPNYKFPEMSTNDINFAHIFTNAIRKVDLKIKAASKVITASTLTASHVNTLSATINNINMTGIVRRKITPKKANYVATPSDNTIVIGGNAVPIRITLPYASNKNLGVEMFIINNTSTYVTASCQAGQTIDGLATLPLVNKYDSLKVVVASLGQWIQT